MSDTHLERLAGVHPKLVEAITAILPHLEMLGHPMFVVEGIRSEARQRALYAKGRTEPGSIVTNVDGELVRGAHQVNLTDGYGHAVDCAFIGDKPWDNSHPWAVYGALVRWHGLKWGGAFKSICDCPHAELK